MVQPGMGTSMVRPGMGSLPGRQAAARGRHGRYLGQRTVASMAMFRGEGHIDGGPRADHHFGAMLAHHPVRDTGRGEECRPR